MNPARVIADLQELHRRTGGPEGARRIAWTDEWQAARDFLGERLAELPVRVSVDLAGNLWAELEGNSSEIVAVGSHLDSVPNGGWLDGSLGVLAGLEVLRTISESRRPARTVALVDWADEEGARFGRSLLGSSAFAGTLDPDAVRNLRDAEGTPLPDALAAFGVDVDTMGTAGEGRRERLSAYLELHIEQGPVLEATGTSCAAVSGCVGIDRRRVVLQGVTAHAGSTPMERRVDAGVAAARVVAGLPEIARRHGGVATAGRIDLQPGIATAVPGRAEILIDQRQLDPAALAAMNTELDQLVAAAATREGCTAHSEPIWTLDPVPFDAALVGRATRACEAVGGAEVALPSGALHDAAEIARVAPSAMIFVSSTHGLSHTASEDTPIGHLNAGITAVGRLIDGIVSAA